MTYLCSSTSASFVQNCISEDDVEKIANETESFQVSMRRPLWSTGLAVGLKVESVPALDSFTRGTWYSVPEHETRHYNSHITLTRDSKEVYGTIGNAVELYWGAVDDYLGSGRDRLELIIRGIILYKDGPFGPHLVKYSPFGGREVRSISSLSIGANIPTGSNHVPRCRVPGVQAIEGHDVGYEPLVIVQRMEIRCDPQR
ncbi:hypothetical protein DFH09DRAFT_1446110 [Mycena vulgaris]|nr:hypothetical protein DFH09DRAFT_1446110 [Mycena vulgaris]